MTYVDLSDLRKKLRQFEQEYHTEGHEYTNILISSAVNLIVLSIDNILRKEYSKS